MSSFTYTPATPEEIAALERQARRMRAEFFATGVRKLLRAAADRRPDLSGTGGPVRA
jgi:hypothetical protein